MPHELTPRYRDASGALHHVCVDRAPCGFWRVLDVGPTATRLVEELTGCDDERPQAEALARDYAQQAGVVGPGGDDDEHEIVWAA